MWISRAKWEAMEKKVRDLETSVKIARDGNEYKVYRGGSVWPFEPSMSINARQAIDLILNRLGLEMVMREGGINRVELEKKAKPKST